MDLDYDLVTKIDCLNLAYGRNIKMSKENGRLYEEGRPITFDPDGKYAHPADSILKTILTNYINKYQPEIERPDLRKRYGMVEKPKPVSIPPPTAKTGTKPSVPPKFTPRR